MADPSPRRREVSLLHRAMPFVRRIRAMPLLDATTRLRSRASQLSPSPGRMSRLAAAVRSFARKHRLDLRMNERQQLQSRRLTIDEEHTFLAAPRGRGFGHGHIRVAHKPEPGPGGPKMWTGAAICQSAYAPPKEPCRTASHARGASHAHTREAGMFVADMTETATKDFAETLSDESFREPLDMYITNNMFDETKLHVAAPGGRRAKRRSTIAHLCQVTAVDKHIIRPPALVKSYTAASNAAVVALPTDPFGLVPPKVDLPTATFYGFLAATDSHSVNKLLSKYISAEVDKRNTYIYSPPPSVPAPGVGGIAASVPAGLRSAAVDSSSCHTPNTQMQWDPQCTARCPECLGRCMRGKNHREGHWCGECGYASEKGVSESQLGACGGPTHLLRR